MEIEKSVITPTLKVTKSKDTDIIFEKPFQADIRSVKEINTDYGKKLLINLQNVKNLLFSVFLNAKSKNLLIEAFGKETEDWKGHLVDLKKETDEKYKKEMIVLYPVK
jgi:hypothetical protein